jgi:hypothetical protein
MLFLLNDGEWDKSKMQLFVADFTPLNEHALVNSVTVNFLNNCLGH